MQIFLALLLTIATLLLRPQVAANFNQPALTSAELIASPSATYVAPKSTLDAKPVPTEEWGKAIKAGEHTYRINVLNDDRMGTPDEILKALNDYRARYGAQPLKTDPRICEYTQSRANYFNSIKTIDAHKGFEDFLENQDGFAKLGFQKVGENSSYGYRLTGVHLIEFVYAQSPEHNTNQLDPAWDRGCVGVSGLATNVIFATSPF